MGRRKGKKTVFLQGGSLEEEAQLKIDSDEEPGGLHIGGAVIYRAPLSTRTAARLPGGRQLLRRRESDAACTAGPSHAQQHDAAAFECPPSDASLDDELRDYLENIEQHDASDEANSSSDAASDAPEQSPPADAAVQQLDDPTLTATATAARGNDDPSLGADVDVDFSSHPGLGYRPGLGFRNRAAATRFTAVGLDDALEGMLGQDMPAGQQQEPTDSSDADSDTSGNTDDSSGSGSSSDSDKAWADGFDPADVDPAAAVVVDAQGRPMGLWDQLTPQQRFPVLTRLHQRGLPGPGTQGAAGRPGSSSNKSKKGGTQPTPRQHGSRGAGDPSTVARMSSIKIPNFSTSVTAAAAKAACLAAAATADVAAAERQQERRQQRSVVKGARGGQLLPGEKKKLRKEKIAAKRAVRQAEGGGSALELLAVVEEFVATGADMTLLPPAGKHKQAFTRALANLYGVKATARGGGGSSNGKTSLILQSTSTTCLLGEDNTPGLAQLEALLSAEVARELTAAAIAAGPAPGAQHSKHKNRSPQHGAGLQRESSRGDASMSVYQQPVSFVPGGVLDPNRVAQGPVTAEGAHTPAAETTAAVATAQVTAYHSEGKLDPEQQLDVQAVAVAAADDDISSQSKGQDVGAFLESLLVDGDEQQQAAANGPASQQQCIQEEQQQPENREPITGDWVLDKEPHYTSAVEGLESTAAAAAAAAAAAGGDDAPMYDRVPLGLRFGCSSSGSGHGLSSASISREAGDADAVAATGAARDTGRQATSSSSSRAVQELEDKFSNLRAVTNPHAARRQHRRQQQEQQRQGRPRHQQQQLQEQRLLNPNTALGPATGGLVVAATSAAASVRGIGGFSIQHEAECSMNMTLGLTAQQVKKAKKQQLRKERREARASAAAEGDMQVDGDFTTVGLGVEILSNTFASFEAHTTGIGSRLLGRWGWSEGQGLGRARQGRAEPLQAARRPRQLGLGAE